MNRDEARTYSADLLEEVNENGWRQILSLGLPPEVEEMLRVLRQLNGDITKLEAREKELSDALITRLMPLEFDDGSEPEPAGANASGANGSAAVGGSKPAARGYSRPTGVNASDTNGSALGVRGKPTTPADPLAGLQIQQRRTA